MSAETATPRTDREVSLMASQQIVATEFARTLERELSAKTAELEAMKALLTEARDILVQDGDHEFAPNNPDCNGCKLVVRIDAALSGDKP